MPAQKTTPTSPMASPSPARRRPAAKALHKATLKYAGCASERSPQNTQPSIIAALASAVELPFTPLLSGTAPGSQSQPRDAVKENGAGTDEAGLSNGHGPAAAQRSANVSTSSEATANAQNGVANTQQQTSSSSGSQASDSNKALRRQQKLATTSLSSIDASKLLYPLPSCGMRGILRVQIKHKLEEGRESKWVWHNGATHEGNKEPGDDELKAICQRYGYIWSGEEAEKGIQKEEEPESRPSRLYLMMLADALLPLARNQLSGVVSPSLIATTGILPLSIFSTGPDIIGHYYDCIISAKQEVIIMTNYWQGGKNVDKIASALLELNRREGLRKERGTSKTSENFGRKIVVKIMWDRGPQTLADLFRLRKPVPPGQWRANGLPEEMEIPHLTVQILNYHRPLMGTFHVKLLLVDRQVALVNSNNIQDRPNVEACFRFEGDIVNAIYDHAIVSWGETFRPPLPCVFTPAPTLPGEEAFADFSVSTAAAVEQAVEQFKQAANVAPSKADGPEEVHEEDTSTEGLSGLTQQVLFQRARDARERLRMDDEEAEEEKERLSSPRRTVGEVMDSVRMPRRRNSQLGGDGGAAPEQSSERRQTMPLKKIDTSVGGLAAQDAADKSAASAPPIPTISEPPEALEEQQRQSARKAGAAWAQKVLGERFKGFEGMQPRSPFASFGFGSSSSNPSSPTTEHAGHLPASSSPTDETPLTPNSKRHFADIVEALMMKEGMRPPGWAEGAMEVFNLGESSSRNVALEVRKARREAAHAKTKTLNIPTSVDEEGTLTSPTLPLPATSNFENPSHDLSHSVTASEATNTTETATEQKEAKSSQLSLKQFPGLNNSSTPSLQEPQPNARRSPSQTPSATSSQRNGHAVDIDDADNSDDDGHHDGQKLAPGSSGYRRVHRRNHSSASGQSAADRLGRITASLDFANNSKVQGEITAAALEALKRSAKEGGSAVPGLENYDVTEFEPYVFHRPHKPVPMAMVNRRPHGTPGHSDIRNPQDAAWLAGFRYAKEHVFIQSPTLNASPIKAAVLAACKRNIRVELWLDLGFNDKSESMPFQGGTNEQVVTGLYRHLRREGKGNEKYLEVFWYTGKDMTRPLNAVRKQRNCHVKFAAFDGQVGIVGSGNQDTQSWWHSQECNIMVDSEQIVSEWMRALKKNQSTHIYGKVDQKDGIWRGQSGREIADTGKEK